MIRVRGFNEAELLKWMKHDESTIIGRDKLHEKRPIARFLYYMNRYPEFLRRIYTEQELVEIQEKIRKVLV